MKAISVSVAILLMVASVTVRAEVYRQTDSQGNVTFTDTPGKGAEAVKIGPVTTIKMPKLRDIKAPSAPEPQPASDSTGTPYSKIRFTSPQDQQAFYSGNGNIELQVTSTPPLQDGDRFEVMLDGQPVGQGQGGTFAVRNVFRGTHKAQVNVVDQKGRPVATGESITFTVHRPSVLN